MNPTIIFGFVLSEVQILILVIIGILLFGRKLPEIGRSLGKGIVEFKKGLKGIEEEIHDTSSPNAAAPPPQQPALDQPRPPQRVTASAPKFEDAAPKSPETAITSTPKFEESTPKFEEKPANTAPPQV